VYLEMLGLSIFLWKLVRLKPYRSALSTVGIPRGGQTGVTESLFGALSEAFRGNSTFSEYICTPFLSILVVPAMHLP
jgi:hypothetical protein